MNRNCFINNFIMFKSLQESLKISVFASCENCYKLLHNESAMFNIIFDGLRQEVITQIY